MTYPFHDATCLVTACGRVCLHRKQVNLSTVFAGQKVGIKQVDEGIWLATFMHYDLGYFDGAEDLQPIDNPFGTRVLPMSQGVRSVTHVPGPDRTALAEGVGFEPTIRFPVYTLSKRAPSATRPSLRERCGGRNIATRRDVTTRTSRLGDPANPCERRLN